MSTSPGLLSDEEAIRELLSRIKTIAVVGLSPKPHRDSNHVARYLKERGYRIVPVYPREEEILGEKVYRRVQDIPGGVDLVDVFRRWDTVPDVVDDVLASPKRPEARWLQLGCGHPEAERRAIGAGMAVVAEQCLMVEHAALLGRHWQRS